MSIETVTRRSAAVILTILAAIVGAAWLDELSYQEQNAEFSKVLEERFVKQSLKTGAWVMDREHVAKKIGMPVTELPSYQHAENAPQESMQ